MTFNILLALIPVLLGWLIYYIKSKYVKAVLFVAWVLFVPNTIYIFTDIIHLIKDIRRVDMLGFVVILLQYSTLLIAGFLTFIFSLYPIERMLRKKNKKRHERRANNLLIGINFLIGFGIVLGRVYRLNSWDIFGETERLIYATVQVLSSPSMIMLVILFGLFANLVYFLFKARVKKLFLKKI